jgi:hypothetical protein
MLCFSKGLEVKCYYYGVQKNSHRIHQVISDFEFVIRHLLSCVSPRARARHTENGSEKSRVRVKECQHVIACQPLVSAQPHFQLQLFWRNQLNVA